MRFCTQALWPDNLDNLNYSYIIANKETNVDQSSKGLERQSIANPWNLKYNNENFTFKIAGLNKPINPKANVLSFSGNGFTDFISSSSY